MLKKALLPLLSAVLLAGMLIHPGAGYAGTQDDIDAQLQKIKKQEADLAQKKTQAEKQASDLKSQKVQEVKSLDSLRQDIDAQGAKLNDLNKQVNDVTLSLKTAGAELDAAEARVAERDKLLKARVRLMYMNGSVSYLDVLFSATSFRDFLDRYYAMQSIVGQDKTMLEANKRDRDLVAAKKKQVEDQLNQVQTLLAQAEDIKQQLLVQEKQKSVMIASLSKKEQEAESISDDADQEMNALIKQRQKLLAEMNRQKNKTAFAYNGGKLAWPVPDSHRITDPFGMRIDPIANVRKLHKGVDIGAPGGTTIVAAEDGVVLLASWVRGYGNTVVIDHGNGLVTLYGHIRNGGTKVEEGQTVKRGEKIAEVGSTGDSTGNHCHFEVHMNDVPTDPLPYLK